MSSPLRVWDGVFSNESCAGLRGYCESFFQQDKNTYFMRGPGRIGPTNTIERALDGFLSAIGDDASYVEYWRRAKWAPTDNDAAVLDDPWRPLSHNAAPPTWSC